MQGREGAVYVHGFHGAGTYNEGFLLPLTSS